MSSSDRNGVVRGPGLGYRDAFCAFPLGAVTLYGETVDKLANSASTGPARAIWNLISFNFSARPELVEVHPERRRRGPFGRKSTASERGVLKGGSCRRVGRPPASQLARGLVLVALLALATSACSSTPIGVRRVSPEAAYRFRTVSALSGSEPSNFTKIILRRLDLTDEFESAPANVIARMHERFLGGQDRSALLFALAELSFLHGKQLAADRSSYPPGVCRMPSAEMSRAAPVFESRAVINARTHFLAAAVYAFAFLFPEDEAERVSLIDPRARTACDLYNLAVAAVFSGDEGYVHPRSGTYGLPFGTMDIAFDSGSLLWGQRKLVDLIPVAAYKIHGLNNRYRRAGVGAALAARTVPRDSDSPVNDFVAREAWVPATLFLQLERPREQLTQSNLAGTLELYSGVQQQPVNVHGLELPLETEPSVALAASLEESRFWDSELATFLGRALAIGKTNRLFAQEPYRPGRVPAVFVHGTNSSAPRWANMVNDLNSDSRIRDRYYFLFFSYDSGNPILYSSMLLRRSLREAVENLDPDEDDPCLRQMVVSGHSQGGLLTKVTAIDSGTRFWDAVYSKPFDEVNLRPETRALVREAAFVEPLPFVRRVVFIATPHRGSFLAGPRLVRRLAARLIEFPRDVAALSAEAAGLRKFARPGFSINRMSTSIDNMSPGHPFIRTLADIPVAPGIAAHSIIAVREGESLKDGSDGVVKYSSAHIEGVESELVVLSGHSTQSNPHTVEEVRRILLLHADRQSCGARLDAQAGGS